MGLDYSPDRFTPEEGRGEQRSKRSDNNKDEDN